MGDTMMRIDPADPRVQGAKMLAVTMEPMGGSPTGQPTGGIVCSGVIAPMKRVA
jgi:anti-sigma-K factor RskA